MSKEFDSKTQYLLDFVGWLRSKDIGMVSNFSRKYDSKTGGRMETLVVEFRKQQPPKFEDIMKEEYTSTVTHVRQFIKWLRRNKLTMNGNNLNYVDDIPHGNVSMEELIKPFIEFLKDSSTILAPAPSKPVSEVQRITPCKISSNGVHTFVMGAIRNTLDGKSEMALYCTGCGEARREKI